MDKTKHDLEAVWLAWEERRRNGLGLRERTGVHTAWYLLRLGARFRLKAYSLSRGPLSLEGAADRRGEIRRLEALLAADDLNSYTEQLIFDRAA